MARARNDVTVVRHPVAGERELAGPKVQGQGHDADDLGAPLHDEQARLVFIGVTAVPRHAPRRGLEEAGQRIVVDGAPPLAGKAAGKLTLERRQTGNRPRADVRSRHR
jgi:hypothetical protein